MAAPAESMSRRSPRGERRAVPTPGARSMTSRQREHQLAQSFDGGRDAIPRHEPDALAFGLAQDDALGGPREDQVPRLERHDARGEAHQVRAREDHVARARGLAQLPVDAALDAQPLRIGYAFGTDEPRAERRETVGALAGHELRRLELKIARAEVVAVA